MQSRRKASKKISQDHSIFRTLLSILQLELPVSRFRRAGGDGIPFPLSVNYFNEFFNGFLLPPHQLLHGAA